MMFDVKFEYRIIEIENYWNGLVAIPVDGTFNDVLAHAARITRSDEETLYILNHADEVVGIASYGFAGKVAVIAENAGREMAQRTAEAE